MTSAKPSAPPVNNEFEMTSYSTDDIVIGIPIEESQISVINPINSTAQNNMLDSIDLNDSVTLMHNNNIAICTTCNFQFIRDEKYKGSRNYYTCEQCRKNYLLRACCQSCCIS